VFSLYFLFAFITKATNPQTRVLHWNVAAFWALVVLLLVLLFFKNWKPHKHIKTNLSFPAKVYSQPE
jgi:FtsH-binding integral membrane protein